MQVYRSAVFLAGAALFLGLGCSDNDTPRTEVTPREDTKPLNAKPLNEFKQTASSNTEGFYKDIFMDSGFELFDNRSLYAADDLKLSYEYIATEDKATQNKVMVSSNADPNGALLYPDGQPRFRLLYTNGTPHPMGLTRGANGHGVSLGKQGVEQIREFFKNGGCYSGSCAGAFIISNGTTQVYESYYQLWPAKLSVSQHYGQTGHFIEPKSPLLRYADFGPKEYCAGINHAGGAYFSPTAKVPAQTEILAKYDRTGKPIHQQVSCWAYKPSSASGRLVVIGSHPEDNPTGEGLKLMKAILLYALDGQGEPQVKAELQNSVPRAMDKGSADKVPAFAKIGDKQFHHFMVKVPEGASTLSVSMKSKPGVQMNLFARKEGFAFSKTAEHADTSAQTEKSLEIPATPGTWYIGVECATTVDTKLEEWGQAYTGNLEVLSGIPYTITATWK